MLSELTQDGARRGVMSLATLGTQQVLCSEDRCSAAAFPVDTFDAHHQQIDLRPYNSWTARVDEVPPFECLEVHTINSVAPFVLVQQLLPILRRFPNKSASFSGNVHANCDGNADGKADANCDGKGDGKADANRDRKGDGKGAEARYAFVVNVSSMEGQFTKVRKDAHHVHTNMAKASLNMFTRTCGERFLADYRILMNSVDTGWIDDMVPLRYAQSRNTSRDTTASSADTSATSTAASTDTTAASTAASTDTARELVDGEAKGPGRRGTFVPPLDDVDGAARILDPIFQQLNEGKAHAGVFFKDYAPTSW
jgi:hypothetical protein